MPKPIDTGDLLPVRLVLRQTGLTADLLRAWERRYRAVQPTRTPGGQRVYSRDEVARLERLRRLTLLGHSIGRIAALPDSALDRLLAETEQSAPAAHAASFPAEELVARCLQATERMDQVMLDAALRQGATATGPLEFAEGVVVPFLREVGDRWHRGTMRVSQEHLASHTVRSVLSWIASSGGAPLGAPRIVLATLPGQRHELGLMLAAAVATAEGWRPVYLGPEVPVSDLVHTVHQTAALVVALGFTGDLQPVAVERDLSALSAGVGPGVKVLLGGSAALALRGRFARHGGVQVTTLEALRQALRAG